MDYKFIEELVIKAKNNDESAKEEIINQFKPFIFNFCKKLYIKGYDKEDLHSECYNALMKSIKIYNPEIHRFVAYGTNSIKNALYSILRTQKHKKSFVEADNISFDSEFEDSYNDENYIDPFLNVNNKLALEKALQSLNADDKRLIEYIYIKNISLKDYCRMFNLNYHFCLRHKKIILSKLSHLLN